MAINEEILESFLNNNISILDEIIGTDAAELTSLLNSATISGMKASDILNDITAASSRSTQATLLNTRLNTMSRVATNTMMKDAPADTKYVYVGPIDEKTRDICLQMASKGPITEKEITSAFGEKVLVDGGGYNCRHKWEIASDEGIKLFEGEQAQQVLSRQTLASVNWKPSMSEIIAKKFVKNSSVKKTIYHATSAENATNIAREGFNLKRRTTTGRIYGEGVYFTDNVRDANLFAAQYVGQQSQVMAIKINVDKMFKFPSGIMDGAALKNKINDTITENIPFTKKMTKYFKDLGYEGLIIPQKNDINWYVVFDEKNITTIGG